MSKYWPWAYLMALPLIIGGLVYAKSISTDETHPVITEGIVCPLTGEELECAKCCPLNE